jgi:hypothetical protein
MKDDDKKIIGNVLKKAGELFWDKPSEQVLLTEYEACISHDNSLSSQSWTVVSLITSASAIALGIILGKDTLAQYIRPLAIAMIVLSILLMLWCCRIYYQMSQDRKRMTQIENKLGMLRRSITLNEKK